MFRRMFVKPICVYVAVSLFIMSTPPFSFAMHAPRQASWTREADLQVLHTTLESAVVQNRLTDLGLSRDEALSRINRLTDKQIRQFATWLDAVNDSDARDKLVILLLAVVIAAGVLGPATSGAAE